jgi:hypothetical protein
MKTFTINNITFTTNENETYFYAIHEVDGKQTKKRISKKEFEQAEQEHDQEVSRKMDEAMERKIEEAKTMWVRHPEGTDLEVPAVIEEHGCVDCSKCNVQNCVHRNCMRRNPTAVGGLGECPRLKVRAEQELEAKIAEVEESETTEEVKEIQKKMKKTRKSKDIAWAGNGINAPHTVTLTTKQVDFIKHLPDTCFWEDGLDSTPWIDVLCDEIGGQFAGKPMTVGAMVSTLCEKGLAYRGKDRINGHKATYMGLTEMGKRVAKELGLE